MGSGARQRLHAAAVSEAEKSTCGSRHGALIVRGKQVFATGFNTVARCRFLGTHDVCIHAEMAAITMFINHFVRRRKGKFRHRSRCKNRSHYDLSDFTVWSIKVSSAGTMSASTPCAMCLHRIRDYGFGRIAFTSDKGEIHICRVAGFTSHHLSSAHRSVLADTSMRGSAIRRAIGFPIEVVRTFQDSLGDARSGSRRYPDTSIGHAEGVRT